MITTIICDWGGVLTFGKYTQSILDVLSKEKPISIEKVYENFNDMMIQMNRGTLSSSDFVKKVDKKFHWGITEENMHDIFKRAIIPNKKMISLLKRLHSKYDLILLSDSDDITVKNLETYHAPMLAIFREKYFSHEIKIAKPNKKIFEYVLADLGVAPSKCVFIDDKKENVDSAEKCGIKGILFSSVEQVEKEFTLLGII